jgi:hypothetical protein
MRMRQEVRMGEGRGAYIIFVTVELIMRASAIMIAPWGLISLEANLRRPE